ncbi:unnamed protein product [Miscanthus lutarioriparius]|uniref:Cytochrome P450 n=1 Tax=Miscanthus lutarioriparius TaxID=422564 RepID=A0A811Q362_9POAL|nr:unnamed protein product [Miscanthus lutarioriparius]
MEEYFVGLPYPYLCLYGSCLLLAVVVARVVLSGSGRKPARLPPGPWQLPVIGSLHHLVQGLPHHTIRDLSLRHGPLVLLRICERTAIVVSSAEAVGEMLKGHDAAFSERPSSPGIEELSRHGQGVIFAPYGDHWRLLRRILMTELLSARRVEAFRRIREDEAARLVSFAVVVVPASGSGRTAARRHGRAAGGQDPSSLFDLRDLFPSSRLVRMLPRSRKAERHRQEMFRLMDDILESHSQRGLRIAAKTGAEAASSRTA